MEEKRNESKTKNFFINVGKALLYFGIYFGFQQIIGFIFAFSISFAYGMSLAVKGEMIEDAALLEQIIMDKFLNMQGYILIISAILTILTLLITFKIRKRKFADKLCIKKIKFNSIMPIATLGITLNLFIVSILNLLPEELIREYAQQSNALIGDNLIIGLLAVVICAPIIEEIIFRALMYTHFKKVMPTAIAVLVSAVIFGLCHGQIIWIIYAIIIGIVFNTIFIRYKSLVASVLLHLTFNLTSFILYFANIEFSLLPVLIIAGIIMVLSFIWIIIQTKIEEMKKENLESVTAK